MNRVTSPQPAWQRCPYLGLHDDSSTCLSYASTWNYCYRAMPPAPVLASHQAEACLHPRFVDCAVFRAETWGRLPRKLRGQGETGHRPAGRVTRLVVLFLLFIILLLLFFYPQSILP